MQVVAVLDSLENASLPLTIQQNPMDNHRQRRLSLDKQASTILEFSLLNCWLPVRWYSSTTETGRLYEMLLFIIYTCCIRKNKKIFFILSKWCRSIFSWQNNLDVHQKFIDKNFWWIKKRWCLPNKKLPDKFNFSLFCPQLASGYQPDRLIESTKGKLLEVSEERKNLRESRLLAIVHPNHSSNAFHCTFQKKVIQQNGKFELNESHPINNWLSITSFRYDQTSPNDIFL